MKLERYCSCGAVLRVDIPKAKRNQALSIWFAHHSGDGHAPATRTEAEHARMGLKEGKQHANRN